MQRPYSSPPQPPPADPTHAGFSRLAASSSVADRVGIIMESIPGVGRKKKANGNVAQAIVAAPDLDLHELLDALHAMQAGEFLGTPAGLANRRRGQDLRCLQYHRRRQSAHGAAARARRRGRRPAGQDPHARALRIVRRRLGRHGGLRQHADRRSAVADHGGHPHRDRGRARRSAADRAARRRRPRAQGRVPALGEHRQHHDQAALACSPPR